MDVGNLHQGITNAFLIVVAIITSTFPLESPSKTISPLPSQMGTQSVSIVNQPQFSSPSAVIKKTKTELIQSSKLINSSITLPNKAVVYNLSPSKHYAPDNNIVKSPKVESTEIIIIPTFTPTPTITLMPTIIKEIVLQLPTPSQIYSQNSLSSDKLFQLINEYRNQLGYKPFIKDEKLCELARYRGPQLEEEIFITGAVHKGLYDLKLPYIIIENMASYPTEQKIFNWWMNSIFHRSAIEGNYTYSCGVCVGNSCAQLFTNYTPRYNN